MNGLFHVLEGIPPIWLNYQDQNTIYFPDACLMVGSNSVQIIAFFGDTLRVSLKKLQVIVAIAAYICSMVFVNTNHILRNTIGLTF